MQKPISRQYNKLGRGRHDSNQQLPKRGITVLAVSLFCFCSVAPDESAASPTIAQKPTPEDAAKLSLSEAKDIIQRGYRYWGSDGASDHASTAMEFNPKQIVAIAYNSDGTRIAWPGCTYETYTPYVQSVTTFTTGIHKGSPLY